MGVSIEIWRMRVGLHNGRCVGSLLQQGSFNHGLVVVLHFCILLTLLVIGNVELNPGPTSYPCCVCNYAAKTTGDHILHQRIHEGSYNYRYTCPIVTCCSTFSTYESVSSHISKHSVQRAEVTGADKNINCACCDLKVAFYSELCRHIRVVHLTGEKRKVACPFPECDAELSTAVSFGTHLSLYHPTWKEDIRNVDPIAGEDTCQAEEENIHEDVEMQDGFGQEGNENSDPDISGSDEGTDDSSDEENSNSDIFEDHLIIDYLARFYAKLEGKLLIPASTVQKISKEIAFISKIQQNRFKRELAKVLKQAGLSNDLITNVTTSVLSMDPLYNTHHDNAPGISLTTIHRRKAYFKKYLKYIAPEEINILKNPLDRSCVVQYVSVKDTLELMLEDTTVQQQIDASFEADGPVDTVLLKDYTSGSVFRNRDVPQKRIDLLMFSDAFSCTNVLGSAKKKHKTVGMYMTIGNLKPHLRSLLKSMRLVQLFLEDILKHSKKAYKKVFEKVLSDLKNLEDTGIKYKNNFIPVRLQFFLGDNLGQHTIGGFLEAFTAEFFCRFCEISRTLFKVYQEEENPKFLPGKWRTPASYTTALSKKKERKLESYKGIKRKCFLNGLNYFHCCDPSLAPCIGHDMLIGGVVDHDLADMIQDFVKKGWFTYQQLNRRLKAFKCQGSDAPNKPAEVNINGEKLGGHAIQNWTLLRLLPIIVGDKVDTADEKWKLYLMLKSICELVFAPALTEEQIEEMRTLIDTYMCKRKCLNNSYKPKHHFFSHYPDLFKKFGPLIHLWTMRFEHYHQFFKRAAVVCGSFINLTFTLASKHQLLQAYQSTGNLFPPPAAPTKYFSYTPEDFSVDVNGFINSNNLSKDGVCTKSANINEVSYAVDQWLLLPESNNINVGQIKAIIYDHQTYHFVVEKFRSEWWGDFGLHKLIESESSLCLIEEGQLLNVWPHAMYELLDEPCFSLKHRFPRGQ